MRAGYGDIYFISAVRCCHLACFGYYFFSFVIRKGGFRPKVVGAILDHWDVGVRNCERFFLAFEQEEIVRLGRRKPSEVSFNGWM